MEERLQNWYHLETVESGLINNQSGRSIYYGKAMAD